jgi:hypothetical protein
MPDPRTDVLDAVATLHEDIPRRTQVSLTMSIDTRDDVGAIRDELNDIIGSRDVTTNDVMRLALTAATRYHSLATSGDVELEPIDRDLLVPLTGVFGRVVDEEAVLEDSDETAE